MPQQITLKGIAPIVVRIGMAFVFLWFGSQQLFHTETWLGFVPDFVVSTSGLTAATLVHFNGTIEILFGLCLILGWFTRASALVLGIHLIGIAFSLGMSAIAVRDFGLSMATLSIFLYGIDWLSLDYLLLTRRENRSLLQ